MKSLYPGHFKPSEAEFDKMWKESIFVFDTNVFLNLYRYSEELKQELLLIIEKVKDKMWIPNKVADEFISDRLTTLSGQIYEYDNTIKDIKGVLSKLSNLERHPFISTDSLEKINELSAKIEIELLENKEKLLSQLSDDKILQKLGELTNGKIGTCFSQEELGNIYTEGEKRVLNKIPPGFVDALKKASSKDNYRIYGDLIIWKQILSKSKNDKKGIIFVSDDQKPDWWLELHGRKISPLPELFQEFISETNQKFYMYTVESFIYYFGQFSKNPTSQEFIEEAIKVRESADKWLYKVIEEQELLDMLREYENFVSPSYVGMKIFVTSVLAEKGFEINHSYAIINKLVERGIVNLTEKTTENGTAKAISLI